MTEETKEVVHMYGFQVVGETKPTEEVSTGFLELQKSPEEFSPEACKHKYWKWKWENGRWTDYRICSICGKVEACVSKLR